MSIFKLLQQYEILQKARKAVSTSQFVALPDWMLTFGNNADVLTSSQRSQAKKFLQGAGKLNPEDVKKLAANRNLDLLGMISERADLTSDQRHLILDSNEPFAGVGFKVGPGQDDLIARHIDRIADGIAYHDTEQEKSAKKAKSIKDAKQNGFSIGGHDTRRGKKKADLYNNLIGGLNTHPNGIKEFLKNGGDDAVLHLTDKSGRYDRASTPPMSGEDIFHTITERPVMSRKVLDSLMDQKNFDSSHVVELMNRPEEHLKADVLKNYSPRNGEPMPPQIINAVMNGTSEDAKQGMLDNLSIALTPDQIKRSYGSLDKETQQRAARRVALRPRHMGDEQDSFISHIINTAPAEALKEFVSSANGIYGNDDNKIRFTPEQKDRLVQRFAAEPAKIGDDDLISHIDFDPHHLAKIAQVVSQMPKPTDHYKDRRKEIMRAVLNDKNLPTEGLKSLMTMPHEDISGSLGDVVKHPNVSPEILRMAYNATKLNPVDYYSKKALRAISSHAQTPSDVMEDMQSGNLENLPLDVKKGFIQNPNTPRDVFERLVFGQPVTVADGKSKEVASDNLTLRAAAASSPLATPADVDRALQDENKDVRRVWINNAATLSPEQWEIVKKDRAPNNRAMAAKRADITPQALTHFLTVDKAAGVNQVALKSPAMTPELRDLAIQKMKPSNLVEALGAEDLSPEQVKALHRRLVEERVARLARVNKQAVKGEIQPEELSNKIAAITDDHSKDLKHLIRQKNYPDELVNYAVQTMAPSHISKGLYPLQERGQIKPEHWDMLLERPDAPGHFKEQIIRGQNLSPERWERMAAGITPNDPSQEAIIRIMANNPSLPSSIVNRFIDAGDSQFLDAFLNKNETERSPEVMDRVVNSIVNLPEGNQNVNKAKLLQNLSDHHSLSGENIEKVFSALSEGTLADDYYAKRARESLAGHHNANQRVLQMAMRDRDPGVKRAATDKIAFENPDEANVQLGGHDVHVHPAVEKLKHLKGQIESMGGIVHKNQLPDKGQGIPSQLFDGKGQISTQGIDKYLDTLQKERFNVTYGEWTGCQRHDSSKPQKVLQLNITNKQVNELKEAGLWSQFQEMHKLSYRSGHPVLKHTLGWARIDDSHPGHWHIDEIQSDFGQGAVRQLEQMRENGQMQPEQATRLAEGLKGIIKRLSGNFKNINHAIFAATHQVAREKGITSTSMDKPLDQARQSSMKTHVDVSPNHLEQYYSKERMDDHTHGAIHKWAKTNDVADSPELGREKFKEQFGNSAAKMEVPLPGHMQFTYNQTPKDVGYEDKNKKEAMPESQSSEQELQYRKLVKSLSRLKELVKLLANKG